MTKIRYDLITRICVAVTCNYTLIFELYSQIKDNGENIMSAGYARVDKIGQAKQAIVWSESNTGTRLDCVYVSRKFAQSKHGSVPVRVSDTSPAIENG